MSCMATTTTNLGLTKPDYTDAADIAVINTNMDTVDTAITATKSDLGIVEDGNTATHSITAGQYVIWKGNLYTASSAIATGTTLSTSNLTAVSNGGLNSLNEQIAIVNNKLEKNNMTITWSDGSANGYNSAFLCNGIYYVQIDWAFASGGHSTGSVVGTHNIPVTTDFSIPIIIHTGSGTWSNSGKIVLHANKNVYLYCAATAKYITGSAFLKL